MNIELSPKEYWKELTYYDALLYCSMLEIDGKNDWRMLKHEEHLRLNKELTMDPTWCEGDDVRYPNYFTNQSTMDVIPVRDL